MVFRWFDNLNIDEVQLIDRISDEFEAELAAQTRSSIAEKLRGVPHEIRESLFAALLAIEIDFQRHAGNSVSPDDYVREHPDFEEIVRDVVSPGIDKSTEEETPNATENDGGTTPLNSPKPASGSRVPLLHDRYEIVETIGRGGMGIVYRAWDRDLKRHVALKMVLAGDHAAEEQLTRFHNEAEAIARLHHPNIVQVYDLGEQDGLPFLSLEFVEGGSLADRLTDAPMDARVSARLCETLARAVSFAHESGVIHRDLKPANILIAYRTPGGRHEETKANEIDSFRDDATDELTLRMATSSLQSLEQGSDGKFPHDESPDHWFPKITDFGLARTIDAKADLTATGEILGTPQYMSPEQAAGSASIGPATDIYSLGAVLYRLIAGRPPFTGATVFETMQMVMEQDTIAPTALQPELPVDISTICLKCLEKQPQRRYSSASDLAEDLQRFLNDEPIEARPVSTIERGIKWSRRHRAVSILLALIALLSVSGLTGILWNYREAVTARESAVANEQLAGRREQQARRSEHIARLNEQEAQQRKREAEEAANRAQAAEESLRIAANETRRQFYFNQISLAEQLRRQGNLDEARFILGNCEVKLRQIEWSVLEDLCRDTSIRLTPSATVTSLAVSDDGTLVALGLDNGNIEFFSEGVIRNSLSAHEDDVLEMEFDQSGHRLMTFGRDNVVNVWDLRSGTQIFSEKAPGSTYRFYSGYSPIAIRRDGRQIMFCPETSVASVVMLDANAVDSNSGRSDEAAQTNHSPTGLVLQGHTKELTGVALSHDGRLAATTGWDRTAIIWDLTTGQKKHTITVEASDRPRFRRQLAFSEDGKTLFTSTFVVEVWDVETGKRLRTLRPDLRENLNRLILSIDGRNYATRDVFGVVRLGDTRTGRTSMLLRHTYDMAMSRNSDAIVASYRDEVILRKRAVQPRPPHITGNIGLDPTDRSLVARTVDDTVELINAHGVVQQSVTFPDRMKPVTTRISTGGRAIAVRNSRRDRQIFYWQRNGSRFGSVRFDFVRTARDWFQLSHDGTRLVASTLNQSTLWNLASAKPEQTEQFSGSFASTFCPGKDLLAIAQLSGNGMVTLVDAQTGEKLRALKRPGTRPLTAMSFADDGSILAAGERGSDSVIYLWDCASGELLHAMDDHLAGIRALSFSPDKQRLISASDDETIRIWEVESGRSIVAISSDGELPTTIGVSSGGRAIATVTRSGLTWLGDLRRTISAGQTVDLLASINPKKHTVRGTWTVQDGSLISGRSPRERIETAAEPKGDYRVSLRFRRGPDVESLGVILPVHGRSALFLIDSFPHQGLHAGLDYIDKLGLNDSPYAHSGQLVHDTEQHVVEFQVSQRNDQAIVKGWFDGTLFYEWQGEKDRLHIHPGNRIPHPGRIAFYCYDCDLTIHKATLKVLSGSAVVE